MAPLTVQLVGYIINILGPDNVRRKNIMPMKDIPRWDLPWFCVRVGIEEGFLGQARLAYLIQFLGSFSRFFVVLSGGFATSFLSGYWRPIGISRQQNSALAHGHTCSNAILPIFLAKWGFS